MTEPVLNQYYPGGTTKQLEDWADGQGAPGANVPNIILAARDPLATDDVNAGYVPGTRWLNTTTGGTAEYTMVSNAAGAAVWSYGGAKLGDPEPSGIRTQAGSVPRGTVGGSFAEEGNIYRNAGAPISGIPANLLDNILIGFQVPANLFDANGRELVLTALGGFGANANGKTLKLWVNPAMTGQTVNADGSITGGSVTGVGTGVQVYASAAQAQNGGGWNIAAQITKFGAAGSNTQQHQVQPIFGSTHGGCTAPGALNQPENAVMNIVLTGATSVATANDVTLNQFALNFCN